MKLIKIGVVYSFMSINIDPEKFAELVVTSNPAKSDDAEDIAKKFNFIH